ncbi:hypothetical protein [Vibrio casei]
MKQPLWERIKIWFCDNFGHKENPISWVHSNQELYTCKRCGRIVSKDLE